MEMKNDRISPLENAYFKAAQLGAGHILASQVETMLASEEAAGDLLSDHDRETLAVAYCQLARLLTSGYEN